MGYLYIFITLVFTVYGQLILKWRMPHFGPFPSVFKDQVTFMIHALLDIWVISSFAAAFLASLTWIAALTKFDLSYAYPYMSLAFIVVLFLSYLLFNEPLTFAKIGGSVLVVVGLIIASR